MKNLTVLMLTYNEEHYLNDAIKDIRDKLTDNIFVLDSYSEDKTIDILRDNGVRYAQSEFISFGKQWNKAIRCCPFQTEWYLKLDPDERVTSDLALEIKEKLSPYQKANAFSMDIDLEFLGLRLGTSLRLVRLWRAKQGVFTNNNSKESKTDLIPKVIASNIRSPLITA